MSIDLQRELEQRVARRRSDGAYPPGLEDELDAHWRRIAHRPRAMRLDTPNEAFERYVERAAFHVPTPEFTSGMPGGTKIHEIVSKTVVRHTQDLVLQLDEFARLVQDVLASVLIAFDDVRASDEYLLSQIETLYAGAAELRRNLPQ
jgi:hypothetical protein